LCLQETEEEQTCELYDICNFELICHDDSRVARGEAN
jgi:hypothetical protein